MYNRTGDRQTIPTVNVMIPPELDPSALINTEPQRIKVFENNWGILVADSAYRTGTSLSASNFYLDFSGVATYVKRIGVGKTQFSTCIPQINQYNQNFIVRLAAGDYLVTLPMGFYTVASFATQLAASLNAATPIFPNVTPNPIGFVVGLLPSSNLISILNVVNPFTFSRYFLSSYIDFGKYVAGIPPNFIDAPFTNYAVLQPALMQYTRYVVITSQPMVNYRKSRILISSNNTDNILGIVRMQNITNNVAFVDEPAQISYFNYDSTTSVGVINVQLFDEYGRDLASACQISITNSVPFEVITLNTLQPIVFDLVYHT